jgi:outer membrane immunogenic protein
MFLFRSLIVATMFLVYSGAAYAQRLGETNFRGMYLGMQAGVVSLQAEKYTQSIGGNPLSGSPDLEGGEAGIFVGGGTRRGNLYLSLEGDAFAGSPDGTLQVGSDQGKVKRQASYSLTGRMGYVVDYDLMAYLRAGYAYSKFRTQATDGSTYVVDDQYIDGLRLGVGVDYIVYPNTFLRGECGTTLYQEVDYNVGGNRYSFDPTEYYVRAGVGVLF